VKSSPVIKGRCLCGDIRFEYRGAPIEVMHCHCESCRRHTSSPIQTWVTLDKKSFRFTQGTPLAYMSSPDVERTHCGRCGSPLTYEGRGEFSVLACALDDPASLLPLPSYHAMVAEKLPWIEIADNLPRYLHGKRDASPVSYGPRVSAERTDRVSKRKQR
jgi:hypothetical protein